MRSEGRLEQVLERGIARMLQILLSFQEFRLPAMDINFGRQFGGIGSRKLLILIVASVISLGYITYQRLNKAPTASDIASKALPAMAIELAKASAGFVLIAGDSHAASLRLPCETVNVAVNGLKARDVRRHLSNLPFPVEPAAVVLIAGTNDLRRKHRPLDRIEAWTSEMRQAIGNFRRVVVTAVPPIGAGQIAAFDPDGVQIYSHRLETMCAEIGCIYVDPWKSTRAKPFGKARDGFLVDDVHLADYGPAARELASLLCPQATAAAGKR